MKTYFAILFFAILLLFALNLKINFGHTQKLIGQIDEDFYSNLALITKESEVDITSIGGFHSSALKVAYKIKNDKIKIIISEFCLSACAAYILPTANSLEFRDFPIIGYHRNPILTAHLIKTHSTQNLQYCHFFAFHELSKLYEKTTVQENFWEYELDALNLIDPKISYEDFQCPETNPLYQNDFWLPNSYQLKNYIGLNFTGSVCADDFAKCAKKVDRFWKKGAKLVIGDKVYVSKGR